jgi:hypothetical protein
VRQRKSEILNIGEDDGFFPKIVLFYFVIKLILALSEPVLAEL